MVASRRLCITLLVVVAPLAEAQGDDTPSTTPWSTTRVDPGSDWSLSKEQLDLVNREIRSAEDEEEGDILDTTPTTDATTTTLLPLDYEEAPEEVEEPSAVSGEHLPPSRHTPQRPEGWTASQEVMDPSYPARRRRQVMKRGKRQIPLFFPTRRASPTPSPRPRPTRRKGQGGKGQGGKGQGEYHGTVLGAVFIKPKPKPTGRPIPILAPIPIRRP